ncbi:MAG TPA: hypothetical protein DHV51_03185 [Opitutae bacterium]|nr:hypothetical protein [Opitutae bacterium]
MKTKQMKTIHTGLFLLAFSTLSASFKEGLYIGASGSLQRLTDKRTCKEYCPQIDVWTDVDENKSIKQNGKSWGCFIGYARKWNHPWYWALESYAQLDSSFKSKMIDPDDGSITEFDKKWSVGLLFKLGYLFALSEKYPTMLWLFAGPQITQFSLGALDHAGVMIYQGETKKTQIPGLRTGIGIEQHCGLFRLGLDAGVDIHPAKKLYSRVTEPGVPDNFHYVWIHPRVFFVALKMIIPF